MPNELSGVDEGILGKSTEGAPWFLLAAYNKIQEEKDHPEERLFDTKEPGIAS